MPINGFVEYQRREYCNDIKCKIQMLLNQEENGTKKYEEIRDVCKSACIHSTYEFHHWLIDKKYELVRPKE